MLEKRLYIRNTNHKNSTRCDVISFFPFVFLFCFVLRGMAIERKEEEKEEKTKKKPRKEQNVETEFVRKADRAPSAYFMPVHIRDSLFLPRADFEKRAWVGSDFETKLMEFAECPVLKEHWGYQVGQVTKCTITERGLEGDVVIYPASRIAEYHNVDQQAQVLLEVISGELKQFSVSFYRIEVEDDKEAYFAPVEISVCHKGHLDVDNFVKVEYSDSKHGMLGFHIKVSLSLGFDGKKRI